MWFVVVTSSFLWINHLYFETQQECLHYAEKIVNVDMGLPDAKRKSLVVECVKKD